MDLRSASSRHDELLLKRLDVLVPQLMDRAGLDAWVLAAREYNEDPVLQTMLPSTWLATARRRTILVFLREGSGIARHAVARYAVGDAFPSAWNPDTHPDQWARLAELLAGASPGTIGINRSATFPLADGLTASEEDVLIGALPSELNERIVSAETAAIGWLETRLPEEMEVMVDACAEAHGLLRRALSREVIEPGQTTTGDVEWWLRQVVHDLSLGSWFHPTASVQRPGGAARDSFASKPGDVVIQPGDLVHIDFGIVKAGFCTDQQQHAYVLQPGETDAPPGLAAGLAEANRLQDLLMAEFVSGRTGNEILTATIASATATGINGLIYTHPIGVHGHAAGPTIGLWDRQDGVPGQGDYELWPNTGYSIELQARVAVPEWDRQIVQFMLEEDAFFDGNTCHFLDGRQTDLWLI